MEMFMMKCSAPAIFAFLALFCTALPAQAGLDLENQTEIRIPAMDLDQNGRLTREEMATYMFYYFDHDGNETLSQGEYYARRPLTILPYDAAALDYVDLDNDGQDDATLYTTETFLAKTMIGKPDSDEGPGIEAYEFMDLGFLRMDVDKSRYIELKEWAKHYQKFAVKKPNLPPKAADQDRYGR
jgi:hypothetical protein